MYRHNYVYLQQRCFVKPAFDLHKLQMLRYLLTKNNATYLYFSLLRVQIPTVNFL
jgi:hypothetical protein